MRVSPRKAWDLLIGRSWLPAGGEVWDSTDWARSRHRTGIGPPECSLSAESSWALGAPASRRHRAAKPPRRSPRSQPRSTLLIADVDASVVRQARQKLPFLLDRR